MPSDFPRLCERTILLSLDSSHYISERGRGGRSSQKFRVSKCSRILSSTNSKLKAQKLLCHALKPIYFGCACGGSPAIGANVSYARRLRGASCQEKATSFEGEEAVKKGRFTNAGSPKKIPRCSPATSPALPLRPGFPRLPPQTGLSTPELPPAATQTPA